MDIQLVHQIATAEATAVTNEAYDRFGGDFGMCGFAWVSVTPKEKGNTKGGRAERKMLEQIGFEKDWTGKSWQLWNPSKYNGQNVDIKEAGARAYAAKMRELTGLDAWAGSRLD
jgi:hypothetical protein